MNVAQFKNLVNRLEYGGHEYTVTSKGVNNRVLIDNQYSVILNPYSWGSEQGKLELMDRFTEQVIGYLDTQEVLDIVEGKRKVEDYD